MCLLIAFAGLVSATFGQDAPKPAKAAVPGADLVGLAVGEQAPDAELKTVDGVSVQLSDYLGKKTVVITFYRGRWCQACTRALYLWSTRADEIRAMGAELLFITPEKPEAASATLKSAFLNAAVFCDYKLEAARKFKVFSALDETSKTAYKSYGMDLGKENASGTWELPAPATFIVDTAGVIRWKFADWDYKRRADLADVVAAVKAIGPVQAAAAVPFVAAPPASPPAPAR